MKRVSEPEPAGVSNAGRAVGVVAMLGSIVIFVYSLGSAREWWEGSSCTLAACGAEDIAWAWYLAAVVGAVLSGVTALWTSQMFRDPGTEHP